MTMMAERFEDMSPRGRLRVLQQADGDMIVAIVPDPDEHPMTARLSVEFCTSGGKSPKTREALHALMLAIAEENTDKASAHRRGESGLGVTEPVPTPAAESRGAWRTYQSRVALWAQSCFGDDARQVDQRTHRFLEEALELAQALSTTAEQAHQLVDYVFSRPVGEAQQEAGGALLTLAALCEAACLPLQTCGEAELQRVQGLRERIKAKHQSRPDNSPLPGTSS